VYISPVISAIFAWGAILLTAGVGASLFEHPPLGETLLILGHALLFLALLVNVVWIVARVLIAERRRTRKR
jgi:hypothetical protein